MKNKTGKTEDRKLILDFKNKFLAQVQFPSLEKYSKKKQKDKLPPFKHTIYLIFIRAKFLFLALTEQIKRKNAFSAYSLLKSYWETVAVLGYLIINAENFISEGKHNDLIKLSHKLAMGGKKYPTKEMLDKRKLPKEEYEQPNVLTMMQKIDKDWNKDFKKYGFTPVSSFYQEYNEFIAEAGHPAFLGTQISGRWLPDGSLLPDVNRSWNENEEFRILNYTALASIIFFSYWDRFIKLLPNTDCLDK